MLKAAHQCQMLIYTHTHTLDGTAFGGNWVQYLAQGPFYMQTEGAGNWTADLPISGGPSELQLPLWSDHLHHNEHYDNDDHDSKSGKHKDRDTIMHVFHLSQLG